MPLIQLKPALERGQYYKSKIYVGGEILFVEQEELQSFEGMIALVEEDENTPDDSNDETTPGEPTPPEVSLSDEEQEDLQSDEEAPNPSNDVTNENLTDDAVDETATKEPVQDEEVTEEVTTPEAGSSIPEGGAQTSGSSKNNRRRGK